MVSRTGSETRHSSTRSTSRKSRWQRAFAGRSWNNRDVAYPIQASRGDVGDLVLYRKPPFDELYVQRADPRIKICAEILEEIQQGAEYLDVGFEASIRDGVVRIKAMNRTVVYQLGDYIPTEHAYYAEWHD